MLPKEYQVWAIIILFFVGVVLGIAIGNNAFAPSCDTPYTVKANGDTYCVQSYYRDDNRLVLTNAIKLDSKIGLDAQLVLEEPENVSIEPRENK